MKKAGIVLIIIEVIVVISGFLTKNSPLIELFTSNRAGALLIAEAIGYLLPGIIGVILVSKANKRERAASAAPTAAASGASPASRNTCPKCGAKTEPGDAFCVNCGTKL